MKGNSKIKSMLSKSDFLQGAVIAVIGLILILFPGLTNRTLFVLIGAAVLIAGIAQLIRFVTLDKSSAVTSTKLASGLILATAGILVILAADMLVALLPLTFGLIVFAGGAFKFQRAMSFKALGASKWFVELILALLCIGAGILIFFNPFAVASTLTRIVGCVLFAEGAGGLITNGIYKKKLKENNIVTDFMED